MLLEVIAISVKDVEDAVRCGADRIELVTGIAEGGLTPSLGLIEAAVRATDKPVNVMLRPHSQSFVYDSGDRKTMLRDLRYIKESGAAGVVFGALTKDGVIDAVLLEEVLGEAGQLDMTFHRAFDECADQSAALRQLAAYSKISRILTSGGLQPAPLAMPSIRRLEEEATGLGTGIRILAGHGLHPDIIEGFVESTGVREVHFGSAVRVDGSFAKPIDPLRMERVRRALERF